MCLFLLDRTRDLKHYEQLCILKQTKIEINFTIPAFVKGQDKIVYLYRT